MSKPTYEVMQFAAGQKCFGSGYWVVQRTVKEVICAAPDRAKAEQIARELREAAEQA